MNIKKENGVTLIALIVTIIILTVIASIAIYSGSGTIKKAKLEEIKTNMLLIEAKAREYVEDANFKMGINPDDAKKNQVRNDIYVNEAKLTKTSSVPSNINVKDINNCYDVTNDTLNSWGLDKIEVEENERYIIEFDEQNASVEIYNTLGYDGKYSSTDIEKIEE